MTKPRQPAGLQFPDRLNLSFFLKRDALVKFRFACCTLRNEVKADATDVLSGLEVLRRIHFFTLYFKLHQPEAFKSHLVAIAEMTADNLRKFADDGISDRLVNKVRHTYFFENLSVLNSLMMACHSFVFAIVGKGRLRFLLDFVFHNCYFSTR